MADDFESELFEELSDAQRTSVDFQAEVDNGDIEAILYALRTGVFPNGTRLTIEKARQILNNSISFQTAARLSEAAWAAELARTGGKISAATNAAPVPNETPFSPTTNAAPVPNETPFSPTIVRDQQPFVYAFQNYSHIEHPVKFFRPAAPFKETAKTGMTILPVSPETTSMQVSNSPVDVTSIAGFNFTHVGPMVMPQMSLSGFFPANKQESISQGYVHPYVTSRGFYSPGELCGRFITAMWAGQPFAFSIFSPNHPDKMIYGPKVMIVTDFQWEFKAGHGADRFWTMTLRQWIPQNLLLGSVKRPTGGHGGHGPTRPPKGSQYIIKKGDCLWNIALHSKVHDGRQWPKIYKLNKKVLNASLKAHHQPLNNPDLIYPGVKITLPKGFY
jgi:nucleoid-associated protein YgaU